MSFTEGELELNARIVPEVDRRALERAAKDASARLNNLLTKGVKPLSLTSGSNAGINAFTKQLQQANKAAKDADRSVKDLGTNTTRSLRGAQQSVNSLIGSFQRSANAARAFNNSVRTALTGTNQLSSLFNTLDLSKPLGAQASQVAAIRNSLGDLAGGVRAFSSSVNPALASTNSGLGTLGKTLLGVASLTVLKRLKSIATAIDDIDAGAAGGAGAPGKSARAPKPAKAPKPGKVPKPGEIEIPGAPTVDFGPMDAALMDIIKSINTLNGSLQGIQATLRNILATAEAAFNRMTAGAKAAAGGIQGAMEGAEQGAQAAAKSITDSISDTEKAAAAAQKKIFTGDKTAAPAASLKDVRGRGGLGVVDEDQDAVIKDRSELLTVLANLEKQHAAQIAADRKRAAQEAVGEQKLRRTAGEASANADLDLLRQTLKKRRDLEAESAKKSREDVDKIVKNMGGTSAANVPFKMGPRKPAQLESGKTFPAGGDPAALKRAAKAAEDAAKGISDDFNDELGAINWDELLVKPAQRAFDRLKRLVGKGTPVQNLDRLSKQPQEQSAVINPVKDLDNSAFDRSFDRVSTFLNRTKELFKQDFANIFKALGDAGQTVSTQLARPFKAIRANAVEGFRFAQEFGLRTAANISVGFLDIFGKPFTKGAAAFDAIRQRAGLAIDSIGRGLKTTSQLAGQVFSPAVGALERLKDAYKAFEKSTVGKAALGRPIPTRAPKAVKDSTDPAVTRILGPKNAEAQGAKSAQEFQRGFKGGFKALMSGFPAVGKEAVQEFQMVGSQAAGAFTRALRGGLSGIKNVLGGGGGGGGFGGLGKAASAASGGFGALGKAASGAGGVLKGVLGGVGKLGKGLGTALSAALRVAVVGFTALSVAAAAVIPILGAVVAGFAAVVKGFIGLAQRGGQLAVAQNSVNVLLGPAAEKFRELAGPVNELSLTTRELNRNAAPLISILRATGGSADELAASAASLTKRAADLAAVMGDTTAGALEKIQAGIRGEIDPLERLGIAFSEADVNAKAATLGFQRLDGVFSTQAKTQARIALIMEKSAFAAGGLAERSDTLIVSQNRLKAATEEVRDQISTAFVPAVEKLVAMFANFAEKAGPKVIKFFNDAKPAINAFGNGLQIIIKSIAAVAVGTAYAVKVLSQLTGAQKVFQFIAGFVQEAAARFKEDFLPQAERAASAILKFAKIVGGLLALGGKVVGSLKEIGEFLGGAFIDGFTNGASIVASFFEGLNTVVIKGLELVIKVAKGFNQRFPGPDVDTKGLEQFLADLTKTESEAAAKAKSINAKVRIAPQFDPANLEGAFNTAIANANTLIAAQKSINDARAREGEISQQIKDANAELRDLVKERAKLQGDTARRADEEADALDRIKDIQDSLRDLYQERAQLQEDENRRQEEYQPTLRGFERDIIAANIAIARAKRDSEAAQLALNAAVNEQIPEERAILDLSGLSLDQARILLARTRETLKAQKAGKKAEEETEGSTKSRVELEEDAVLAKIAEEEAAENLRNLLNEQADFQSENLIILRELAETREKLGRTEAALHRDAQEAQTELNKLRSNEAGIGKEILDLDKQIADKKKSIADLGKEAAAAARETATALAAAALSSATIQKAFADASGDIGLIRDANAEFEKASLRVVGIAKSQLEGFVEVGKQLEANLAIANRFPASRETFQAAFKLVEDRIAAGAPDPNALVAGLRRVFDALPADLKREFQPLIDLLITAFKPIPGGSRFLAQGDIITRATQAVVGEAGAEAVLPLTRPGRMQTLLSNKMVQGPVLKALHNINPTALQNLVTDNSSSPKLVVKPGASPTLTVDTQQQSAAAVSRQKEKRDRDALAGAIASAVAKELAGVVSSSGNTTNYNTFELKASDHQVLAREIARKLEKKQNDSI